MALLAKPKLFILDEMGYLTLDFLAHVPVSTGLETVMKRVRSS
jgi:hypothetical protein